MVLENLKAAGVQQAHKEDRITFTSLTGWPGTYICAEGLFMEGDPAEGGKRDRAPAGQAAPAEASAQPVAKGRRPAHRHSRSWSASDGGRRGISVSSRRGWGSTAS
jgi:hypothetical protein